MENWIKKLQLERHVEGGHFNLFYKATDKVVTVDNRYDKSTSNKSASLRSAGTSIYFLLEKDEFSAWHRLKSDEVWHYYDGDSAIDIHSIDEAGNYTKQTLGHPGKSENANFQVLIKAGTWFAAELQNKSSAALVGCTVFPGFEYQDFILANRNKLIEKYPEHTEIIKRFTYAETVDEMSI